MHNTSRSAVLGANPSFATSLVSIDDSFGSNVHAGPPTIRLAATTRAALLSPSGIGTRSEEIRAVEIESELDR